MPLMTGSLSDSPRRLGGSGYASAARRLRNNGYGRAAEQMALASETERMQKGSGVTRAEDRVVGGQIQERQAAALNQLRMQRLVNGYRDSATPAQSATAPKTVYTGSGGYVPRTTSPATGGSPTTGSTPATSKSADPNYTDDPFKTVELMQKREGEAARRANMRAELDKVTGTPAGAGNAAEMETQFQKERADAIKTARERSATEGGYTTRGGVIDEMNKARRAAGQKEFDISGKEFAEADKRDEEARRLLRSQAVGPKNPLEFEAAGPSKDLRMPEAAGPSKDLRMPEAAGPSKDLRNPDMPGPPTSLMNPVELLKREIKQRNAGATNPADVKFENPLKQAASRFKQEQDKKLKTPLRSAWLAAGSGLSSVGRSLTQTY